MPTDCVLTIDGGCKFNRPWPHLRRATVPYDEPTSKLRMKGTGIVLAVMGALALWAAPAMGDVTVTHYWITSDLPPQVTAPPSAPPIPSFGPSTVVAGAHPDAGSYTRFSYSNGTDDLETALTNFGAGLLGNPESVPKCPEAALQAGGTDCPAGSQIGTSRLDVQPAGVGSAIAGFSGRLYNAELLGNEPGRLAAVTTVGAATLVSSIPFTITPRGGGDYGLTGTLTDISRLDVTAFGNLQTYALSFIINGSQNNYVRNPTSCELNVSTGQASSYENETFVDGPAYQFATTGCEQVPYTPKTSLTIGDRGSTQFNKFPPFVFKLSQGLGEADTQGNKLTLPIELNTNNTAYTLCSQEQADADNCPAASKFGWATAKSPFLGELVQGPVYLIQQTATSLPGLLLDLRGRVHVKVQTKTTLINGKQIQSLVLNAPQLPVSELTVALNGGRKTGVFQNRQDLCFKGDSTTRFNSVTALAKNYGWNGKQTGDDKVTATVLGCGPAVRGKLRSATRSRPSLTITATKHPDAVNMKSLRVSLSKNLTLSRSRLSRGSASGGSLRYVNRHAFRVTGLPAAGSAKVTIRLRRGAVRVSARSRSALKRGRSRGFSIKVSPTPVSGKGTSTKTKFRVRG
jgi:hypothetical protein